MKKIIRLTESELNKIIGRVTSMIVEDVLGDNWHENEEDVHNNYEPFEDDPFEGYDDHDFSVQGEKEFDPTEYDPEAYMDYNQHDPSDTELYNYMA